MNPKILKNRLQKIFKHTKVSKILLVNTSSQDPNFVYLTDFYGGLFEGSILLVEKNGVTLFTYPLEYETAKSQAIKGMKIINLDKKEKFNLLINSAKGKAIGVNESFIPFKTYKNIKKRMKPKSITDISEAFLYAREVKDTEEITRIRKANKITKKAIDHVLKNLRIGMTEREAASEYENYIQTLGADGPSFDSIVCFGANAALPHHMPDNTKLKYGDFVLIDVGAKVHNYCSDVTRTVIFGSNRSKIKDYEKKSRIVNTVYEAQSMAISKIKEGAIGSSIHKIAEKHINSAFGGIYKGTFIHSLGHSIGIEVHDGTVGSRALSPGSNLKLKQGMISSVEPGIYIPGFGGARKEDDIVVTKKGCEVL
ncbi:MAG: aminopeptidase P family protein [Candidatus Micrarchaeota archaeon]|nr:aminopeptidase P family protein [Candidatus Micrarchaeota archaeon]